MDNQKETKQERNESLTFAKALLLIVPTAAIATILFFIPEPTQVTTIAAIAIIGSLYSRQRWAFRVLGIEIFKDECKCSSLAKSDPAKRPEDSNISASTQG